ncbi:MAG TPA: toll/interleukin-1 receptor domain-containing protein [Polyangiaceae bacterium]|nr:toll/interleukin-1 receptor domain-containing protein [Polyangiaceae bacterium]
MRKIFICYRRADAEYAAGALGRELRAVFGEAQVFRDKENFGAGKSWREQALHEIDRDAVLVVLIGRSWSDASAPRRLEDPDDPVRAELLDARQDGAAIIPVLLENVDMPKRAELPPELHWLCEVTAPRLRDADWHYDLGKIFASIEGLGFKRLQAAAQPGAASVKADGAPWSVKLVIAAAVFVLCLFGILGSDGDKDALVGLAILGGVATGFSVFAYRDATRGLVRGRRSALAMSVVGGFLTVGGFLYGVSGQNPPSDASKAVASAEPAAAASAEPAALAVRTQALQPAPQALDPRFLGFWHQVGGDMEIQLAGRDDKIWFLEGDKMGVEGELHGKAVEFKLIDGAHTTRLELTLNDDDSLQVFFEGDQGTRSVKFRRK